MNQASSDLRQYQREGIAFLASRGSALLADEMGLGKTVQAIRALELTVLREEFRCCLIVAPAPLCLNWESEFRRWSPRLVARRVQGSQEDRLATYQLPITAMICSYEQIRSDFLLFDSRFFFDIVVLDEAQRIKNASSTTALACRIIPRKVSWALTGTPIENHADDLVSIFGFVKPRLLRRAMCRTEMHSAIQPFYLRRRKRDVLPEMPRMQVQDVPLELTGNQLLAYCGVWGRREAVIATGGADRTLSNVLAFIGHLKRLCNFDSVSGESVKLDWLRLFIASLSDSQDKVLVFSQYVETLVQIRAQLASSIPTGSFHGKMSGRERQAAITEFEDNRGPRLLLVSLRAGGVGLNIPSASHVILFDRWWNPAVEDQAVQRAHRFGRNRILFVIRLVVKRTIEEKIDELLKSKRMIFDAFVDEAPSSRLSRDDIFGLLASSDIPFS